MKISTEFSKHADEYETYNTIQQEVVEKLLREVEGSPRHILDLGCGSGSLCKRVYWEYEHFVGVDFAPKMLELHPKSKKIEAIYGDFNDPMLFEHLATYEFDYIFSASALQWADDLASVFKKIHALHTPFSLAIFTSGTFQTIHTTADIEPLLRSAKDLKKLQKSCLPNAKFEIEKYKLHFNTTREMFQYIKRSGVSGSRSLLNYKQTKELMKNYPLSYLEFEVAFIKGN